MDKRCAILLVSVTIFVLCFVGTASATNWSVDGSGGADFTRIQDAINNAKEGDTILVYSGVYYENVYVNKSVTLKGVGHPVVDANGSGSAITLTADGFTLQGFNATNSGSSWSDVGIKVTSNNNTITGNNVRSNGVGIYLSSSSDNNTITGNNVSNNNWYGIRLYDSSNNNITGNTFVNDGLFVDASYQNTVKDNIVNGKPLVYLEDASDYKVEDAGQVILVNCNNITVINLNLSNTSVGVELWKTEDSKVLNNTASNNNLCGIRLDFSSNNIITGNNVSNNNDNGIRLSDSSNNIITGNNASNNNDNGIRLSDSSNNNIAGNNVSNNDEGIFLHSSNNNNVTGNTVSNHKFYSIYLIFSSNNNTITGNNVRNNNHTGIGLSFSSNNNTITGNNVSNNNYKGIIIHDSNNNSIYLNNFINNNNVDSYESTTIWNSPLEITYTYRDTAYTNYLGNNWDDYEGTDAEGDGIGDTHYSIDSEGDESDDYPIMKPFENYILPRSAPT